MKYLAVAAVWLGAFGGGVYLIMHDHATIGGWIAILCVLGGVSFKDRDDK